VAGPKRDRSGRRSPRGTQRPSPVVTDPDAPTFFHAYDVRARYPAEIDASASVELGRAIARAFPGPLLLGWDTRPESVPFSRSVVRGLRSEEHTSELQSL
jgi:phosphomannomutase